MAILFGPPFASNLLFLEIDPLLQVFSRTILSLPRMKKIKILGLGGFAKEVYACLADWLAVHAPGRKVQQQAAFVVKDADWTPGQEVLGAAVVPQSSLNPEEDMLLIAVSDCALREKIAASIPEGFAFFTLVHPTVVMSEWVRLGEGSIVCAGSILTCDIEIGRHAHLNLHTTVGHDCRIGDFFTTAPGVHISGNCSLADRVYIGTNAALKQGIRLGPDITIGMGAVVTKNLQEAGVYVGAPAKRMGA
jgi:sugar O-acyltransferase (sialic acid O-acetyltransferase NeuD family)